MSDRELLTAFLFDARQRRILGASRAASEAITREADRLMPQILSAAQSSDRAGLDRLKNQIVAAVDDATAPANERD